MAAAAAAAVAVAAVALMKRRRTEGGLMGGSKTTNQRVLWEDGVCCNLDFCLECYLLIRARVVPTTWSSSS